MRLVALALLMLWSQPAWAEIAELEPGAAAPYAGVLFDDAALQKVIEETRNARSLAEVSETLKAQIGAKDREIVELQAQVVSLTTESRAREIAMAIAEDRDKRRQEIEDRYEKIIDRQGAVLDRADKALEAAAARIESLERRQFWTTILAPLGMIGAFAMGIFIH